jgi:hypothetical protein
MSPPGITGKVPTARDGAPPFSRRASSKAVRQLFSRQLDWPRSKVALRWNFCGDAIIGLNDFTASDRCTVHGSQPVFPHPPISSRL